LIGPAVFSTNDASGRTGWHDKPKYVQFAAVHCQGESSVWIEGLLEKGRMCSKSVLKMLLELLPPFQGAATGSSLAARWRPAA